MIDSQYYWTVVVIGLSPLILWASWIDYKEKKVPNYLNLIIAISGIIVQSLFFASSGVLWSFEGLALGLGLLIIPWAMYMMGAGDVKLLAGIGAWIGPGAVLWSFVIGAIIGACVSILMIARKNRWSVAAENFHLATIKCTNPKLAFSDLGSVKSLGDKAQLIPYGVPLTAGTLIVILMYCCGLWS